MANENKLKCAYTLKYGKLDPNCPYTLYRVRQRPQNSSSATITFLAMLYDKDADTEKWVFLKMFYNFAELGIKTPYDLKNYNIVKIEHVLEDGVVKNKQVRIPLITKGFDVQYSFKESYKLLYERELYKYITNNLINKNQSYNFVAFISNIDMTQRDFSEFCNRNSPTVVNYESIFKEYGLNIESFYPNNTALLLSGSITETILYENETLTLFDWLIDEKYRDDVKRAYKDVWFQILYNLSVMSHNKITHNDLHQSNILMKKLPNIKKMFFTIKYGVSEYVYMIETDIVPYFYDWDLSHCEAIGSNPNICDENFYIVFGSINAFNPYADFHRAYSQWYVANNFLKDTAGRNIDINELDKNGVNLYETNQSIVSYFKSDTKLTIPMKLLTPENNNKLQQIASDFTLISIEDLLKMCGVDNDYEEKYKCLKTAFDEEKSIGYSDVILIGSTVLQLLELRFKYGIFASRIGIGEDSTYYELELSRYTDGCILTSLSEKIMSPLYILTHTYDTYVGEPSKENNCVLNIDKTEYTCITSSVNENKKRNLIECKNILNSIRLADPMYPTPNCTREIIEKIINLKREF